VWGEEVANELHWAQGSWAQGRLRTRGNGEWDKAVNGSHQTRGSGEQGSSKHITLLDSKWQTRGSSKQAAMTRRESCKLVTMTRRDSSKQVMVTRRGSGKWVMITRSGSFKQKRVQLWTKKSPASNKKASCFKQESIQLWMKRVQHWMNGKSPVLNKWKESSIKQMERVPCPTNRKSPA